MPMRDFYHMLIFEDSVDFSDLHSGQEHVLEKMEELWQHRKRHKTKKTGRITKFLQKKREHFKRSLGSNSSGETVTSVDDRSKQSEVSDDRRRQIENAENQLECVSHVLDKKVESLHAESLQELQSWLSAELERQLAAIREKIVEDLDRRLASALAQGLVPAAAVEDQIRVHGMSLAEELSSLQPPLLDQEQLTMKLGAQIATMSQRLQGVVQDLSKATARLDRGLHDELERVGRSIPARVQLVAEPWDSQAFECPPYMTDLAAVGLSRSIRSCSRRSTQSSSSASSLPPQLSARSFLPRTQLVTSIHDSSCACSMCNSRRQTAI